MNCRIKSEDQRRQAMDRIAIGQQPGWQGDGFLRAFCERARCGIFPFADLRLEFD
jgi:hypothetical protein